MKILITITSGELAGAQVNVFHLASFLSQKHDVYICAGEGNWLPEQIKKTNAKYIHLKPLRNSFNPVQIFSAFYKLRKIIEELKPDVISCHSSMAGLVTRLSATRISPVVFSVHGWSFESQNVFLKYLLIFAERALANLSKRIICESRHLFNLGKMYKICNNKNSLVIRNGIETFNKKINKNKKKYNFIFIGRLTKQKDAGLLIQAFSKLPDITKKNAILNIIGDGCQKIVLKKYVKRNVIKNIYFLGQKSRSDMFKFLIKSDCLVLTTNWEGMPYTILEAMAHGLPVIASNVGSIHEVVTKKTGILVPRGQIKPLIKALSTVYFQKKKYRRIGLKNKTFIAKKYCLKNMYSKTESLFYKCRLKGI